MNWRSNRNDFEGVLPFKGKERGEKESFRGEEHGRFHGIRGVCPRRR